MSKILSCAFVALGSLIGCGAPHEVRTDPNAPAGAGTGGGGVNSAAGTGGAAGNSTAVTGGTGGVEAPPTPGEGGAEMGGAGGTGSTTPPTIKVMTFNIRYGTAADGADAWDYRKQMVFDVFSEQNADFVGVQEALAFQLEEIEAAVPGYARIGVGRADGIAGDEFSAIFYRAERFDVAESSTYWFSDTPEVPGSMSWGNGIPRICTWGRFVEKATGYGLYHYNVHLDHQSQPSREKSAWLLMARAAQRLVPEDPIVITGDFNAPEDNAATLFMKGEAQVEGADNPIPMVDSFRALFPDQTQTGTFNGFSGDTSGGKIDFVFMGPGVTATSAEIVHTSVDGHYPSDHFPVTGTLVMPAVP
jgi:endonuclease/exonuclease/phosphatase family metal-dependent hydrolase